MEHITALLLLIATAVASRAQAESPSNSDVTALRTEIERLKGMVPDQSHAMKDVAYHFTNLWFAAQKLNWPLADFLPLGDSFPFALGRPNHSRAQDSPRTGTAPGRHPRTDG
jgi:hypothetical protein